MDFQLERGRRGSRSPLTNDTSILTRHRYVLWLMYGLFPMAFPIAKVLDLLLGDNHGMVLDRSGLKTLLTLHEGLHQSKSERLTRDAISILASVLDFDRREVSSVMTPIAKVFSLSSESFLNDMTRYNILKSGCSNILIHLHTQPNTFLGLLPVKSLVSMNLEAEVTLGQVLLEHLPVVYSAESCLEILAVFRDPKIELLLVIEQGTGLPLGIVTARDIFEELIRAESKFNSCQCEPRLIKTSSTIRLMEDPDDRKRTCYRDCASYKV